MGKQSRRNRARPDKPTPKPGYGANGVPLPPGAPGSLFDVFKGDPWAKNGGFFQFVVLPLDPMGDRLNEALAADDVERYRGFMRAALGLRDYKRIHAAIHEYDRLAEEGEWKDSAELCQRVRDNLHMDEQPSSAMSALELCQAFAKPVL
jgi:hypothetical protein